MERGLLLRYAFSLSLIFSAFSILTGMSSSPLLLVGGQGIGVNYGMKGNNLPYPTEVISLYKSRNIGKLRLFHLDTNRQLNPMKFKAFLTQDGVNILDMRFLPSLDKIGRVCHLYLTGDHAIFVQNLIAGDTVQSVAQFKKEVLFHEYRISSQNEDCIAFAIDVAPVSGRDCRYPDQVREEASRRLTQFGVVPYF